LLLGRNRGRDVRLVVSAWLANGQSNDVVVDLEQVSSYLRNLDDRAAYDDPQGKIDLYAIRIARPQVF